MKKLKLQMQMSIDGFVAGPNGELDWLTWNWDDELKKFVYDLHESIDTILMGRKMTEGFTNHWEAVTDTANPEYEFAQKMVNTPKIIFSKTVDSVTGKNTTVVNGDLADEVNRLKKGDGKDMIAYGGANFVSSLTEKKLIDDLYIFVNPTAIGNGLRIFNDRSGFKLVDSNVYDCGIIVNLYQHIK